MCVQMGHGAYPASQSQGLKQLGCETDHTHPTSTSYTSTPPYALPHYHTCAILGLGHRAKESNMKNNQSK